jgi:uncharacterized membrane protein
MRDIITIKRRCWAGIFILLAAILISLAGYFIFQNLANSDSFTIGIRFQECPDMAKSFWRGELSIPSELQPTRYYSDIFPLNDKLFLPFGPLPALIFMPFVLLSGAIFPTTVITFLFIALAGILIFKIARWHGLKENESIWIAAAYALGSALTPLAIPLFTSWSVQLFANVFLLAALYTHLMRRAVWLTGILLALAVLTRPLSVIGVLVFILWNGWEKTHEHNKKLIKLFLPLLGALIIFAIYNYARFDTPWQTGYRLQWEYNPALLERMVHGVSDLHYLPINLWYFLFAPPKIVANFPFVIPDAMGMGLFFSCPYLIYLFTCRNRRRLLLPLGAAAVGVFPALIYYANGYSQIGYRYAVDVYPLIFLTLISSIRNKLPTWLKILIVLSVLAHTTWIIVYSL